MPEEQARDRRREMGTVPNSRQTAATACRTSAPVRHSVPVVIPAESSFRRTPESLSSHPALPSFPRNPPRHTRPRRHSGGRRNPRPHAQAASSWDYVRFERRPRSAG
ncbi:protein of unknown function [Micropruina glycogenica]|uniref:Uncharacterized protein n=1 Tax=Micropruina glycogenica TaxID=75385 RepID=A0A2N9JC22_9ACTN|nr:protein of unknown function [Micropruina glycogenica]